MQGHRSDGRSDRTTATTPRFGPRGRQTALLAGMVMLFALSALASQAQAALPLTPVPTFVISNDENGADDQPGQKDLSLQGVATPNPGDLWTMWQWDVTSLSGGNTGDACSLFDTDSDSKINYAVCVTIQSNPAVQAPVSPRVYECGDGKVDRCSSTSTQDLTINTACGTNTTANDPFHAGQKDTQAICHIDLADVGGSTTAKLVNTCSYPSQSPTSDPSDCVLIPRDAFVIIQKIASPNAGTFDFRLGTGTPGTNPVVFTATGSQTSTSIAIRSGVNTFLKEDVPANWAIDTPAPVCTGATGSGTPNGTFSGDTISNIKAQSDNVITCVFRDKQLTGAIKITKLRSGTSIGLAGAEFTIDGVATGATGSDGTVCVAGLAIGSHTVIETRAPNGHSLPANTSQSIPVTSAGTCASGSTQATATFNDPIVPGSITVNKFDLGNVRIGGAVFALYIDNATVGVFSGADALTSATCVGTGTTGQCTFGSVAPGDYVVVETSPPPGYTAIPPKFVTVNVGGSPGTGDNPSIRFDDPPAPGSITIEKSGFNGLALDGAVFTLYKDTVAPFGAPVSLGDVNTGQTCTTGDPVAGQCSFADLAPGLYILKETTTPDGYATVDDVAVEVPIGTTPGTGADVTVEIENDVVPGRIEIHKRGIDGTDLAGATFTLYVDNPVLGDFDPQTDDDTGETCTTEGDGDCFFAGVTPGNYIVVETTTPNGYDTADPQAVVIGIGEEDPNGDPNEGDTDELEFDDPVVPGTVTITKTSDAGGPLGGATFALYRDLAPTGGSIDAGGVTDPATNPLLSCLTVAGTCDITDVPPGDYWIVETDAPDGYDKADPKPITVGVGDQAPHVGDAVGESFVDARQHRVVVLVCHEGSDTLFSRDVTVDGETKQSLAAGSLDADAQKDLCDLGGASFGDISGHGVVTADVDLGNVGP